MHNSNLQIIINFQLFTNQWILYEMYNPGIYHRGTLRYLYYGTWCQENGFEVNVNDNLYFRRQNTGGILLRAGIVVSSFKILNSTELDK